MGASLITSFKNSRYYVIFVDYFTKYMLLCPLKLKSNVLIIFFIILRMSLKIVFKPPLIMFTDEDGGYQSLAHTLTKIDI